MPNLFQRFKNAFQALNCRRNQATAEPVPQATAEPVPQAIAEPAPQVIAEPAPQVIAEPAPQAIAEPAPQAIAEPPIDYEVYVDNLKKELFFSIINLNADKFSELLAMNEPGVDVNTLSPLEGHGFSVCRETTLHTAARNGATEIGKIILEKNPNLINVKNLNYGDTPLHRAIGEVWTHTPFIKLLLKNGADVNIENNYEYFYRRPVTPLLKCNDINVVQLLINHGAETIGVRHVNPAVNTLIQTKATELTSNLTALTGLPDDVSQLTDAQKSLFLKLTAPKKAGNPLEPRAALGNKTLVDYMREEKPKLLMFAEGYHKDKIFGGIQTPYTDIQETTRLYTELRECPPKIYDNKFFNTSDIKQEGSALRQKHDLKQHHDIKATKIQALGRGFIAKNNLNTAKLAATKIQALRRGFIARENVTSF
jgi:hypothetical protein